MSKPFSVHPHESAGSECLDWGAWFGVTGQTQRLDNTA